MDGKDGGGGETRLTNCRSSMEAHARHTDRCQSRPLRAVQICPQHHMWPFARTPPGSLWLGRVYISCGRGKDFFHVFL
eukprot:6407930-Prymnesium_polylepis.1